MRRNGWTEYEDSVVRQYYPLGSSGACYPRLTGRSLSAIENRARTLGIFYEQRKKRPVVLPERPETAGKGPERYRYQWEPLKPAARLLTRPGADDWKTVPSLR